MAELGSPRWSLPNLSISSNMMTGLEASAFIRLLMMRPGIAPIYVFRCPRISASSCTPPNDIRTYFRFKASAIERPKDVFPTPGGPYRHTIGDFMSPFSFSTARCSKMRSFTFSNP